MAEKTIIEGVLEGGEFRQTNGQSFDHWLAEHDRAVRDEALREAAATRIIATEDYLNARADEIEAVLATHDRAVKAEALREAATGFRFCADYGYRATEGDTE